MRILSQTGTTDLPYEKIGVSINAHDNQEIVAYGIEVNDDNYWTMARYSTAEKAQKAMDMLHKKYMSFSRFLSDKPDSILPKVFKFPSEYDVDKALNESEE